VAQPTPSQIERFLDLCESSRRGAILQLEYKLRGLRAQSPPTRETSGQIARVEDQLRVLRANEEPVVPQIAFPPQVGAIGRLPGLSCHVEQVVSDKELLIRCFFPVVVRTVDKFTPRRETVTQQVRFLVRGVAAKDVGEGSDLELLEVYEIAGKQRLKTIDGASQQVLLLTPFDMKAVEPYFRRLTRQNR
jgi:hypothetical protein